MTLPTDRQARKDIPIARGCLDYFPDALAEVAHVSRVANEQHNPGEPMHWAKEKSTDEADALLRHLIERGGIDTDGLRHSAKVAWRALALLQRELDAEANLPSVTPEDTSRLLGGVDGRTYDQLHPNQPGIQFGGGQLTALPLHHRDPEKTLQGQRAWGETTH